MSSLSLDAHDIIVFGSNFNPRIYLFNTKKEGELEVKKSQDKCFNHVAIHSDTSSKRITRTVYASETDELESLQRVEIDTLTYTKLR